MTLPCFVRSILVAAVVFGVYLLVSGIAQLHGAVIKTGPGLDGRGFSVRVLFPLPAAGSTSVGAEVVPAQPA